MLPPELTDRIIDYLHDDKRALSKCGRVARSWVVRSRIYLWQKITLDGSYKSSAEQALFLDFIRASPRVPVVWIQHLELALLESPLADDIISQLPSLPSLGTLVLTSCSFRLILPDGPPVTLSATVRKLVVSHLTFPNTSTWHSFVCAFPNLQTLALGESTQILRRAPGFQPPTRLTLQRLELGFSEANAGICTWLNTAIASTTTVRLDKGITGIFTEFVELALDCLDAAEHLEFEGGGMGSSGDTIEFNLAMCVRRTQLKTLIVNVTAHHLPLCTRVAYYRLGITPLPPLDRLTVVFLPGGEDLKQTGAAWAASCFILKHLSEHHGTASTGPVVLRAAYPAKWDEHLLAGVAPMAPYLPLRLEQQDEDGTISEVHLK